MLRRDVIPLTIVGDFYKMSRINKSGRVYTKGFIGVLINLSSSVPVKYDNNEIHFVTTLFTMTKKKLYQGQIIIYEDLDSKDHLLIRNRKFRVSQSIVRKLYIHRSYYVLTELSDGDRLAR